MRILDSAAPFSVVFLWARDLSTARRRWLS